MCKIKHTIVLFLWNTKLQFSLCSDHLIQKSLNYVLKFWISTWHFTILCYVLAEVWIARILAETKKPATLHHHCQKVCIVLATMSCFSQFCVSWETILKIWHARTALSQPTWHNYPRPKGFPGLLSFRETPAVAYSVMTSPCRIHVLSTFLPGPKHECHVPASVERKHIPFLNYESPLLDFILI